MMQLKPIFFTLDHLSHQAKWLRSNILLQEFTLCVLKWMWGLAKELVDWWVNDLGWGIRVLIGLEKLECTKRIAHAICYVFLRMLGWRLERISFGNKLPSLYLSFLSFWKVYLRTSKGLVWGSWYLMIFINFRFIF